MGTADNNSFGKAICSICYEDLKPIVEDLQSISICGHVFHELCLQQWFEYSANAKKHSCPVCNQKCTAKNVGRLYFQSVGDQLDGNSSQIVNEADAEVLRYEAKRLEAKVAGLSSILERRVNEIKELSDELSFCKEQMTNETLMKSDALRQKASIQNLLQSKSEELAKLFLECSGLREKNMNLGKELAAMKLVTDLNLDEDDVLKFASLGRVANSKDTVDILRKSLVIRNKSYTELMAKCNLLGRGEAHYSKKLEKATTKINKLKTRVQELETAIEANDNNTLRELKTSKEAACQPSTRKGTNDTSNTLLAQNFFMDLPSTATNKLDRVESLKSNPFYRRTEDTKYIINKDPNFMSKSLGTEDINKEKNAVFAGGVASTQTKECVIQKCTLLKSEAVSDINEGLKHEAGNMDGPSGSKTEISSDRGDSAAPMDQDVILFSDDGEEVDHAHSNINQKFPSPLLTKLGDICFSGGLLGPDGTTRYLGKWCKRGQANESMSGCTSTTSRDDLIAVGADGRGGRTKVLRTLNQRDGTETSSSSKRSKYGSKTSSSQPRGNFQMEHFFGRESPSSNV